MSDTDIDFLDYEAAREYVVSFIAALKRAQKERAIAQEELALWERRVKLAESRAEPILKRGAEERVRELRAKTGRLLDEEASMRRKVDVLKEKLKALKVRSSMSVDADALLAQLQMLAGEPDTLSEALRDAEASQALDQLKRKLADGRHE
jgi:succinate dehydrogenase/fumarate reductase flavoprotein subunit